MTYNTYNFILARDKISNIIKGILGNPSRFLRYRNQYTLDHDDLVRLCYAVLEEFIGPQEVEFEKQKGKMRILEEAYIKKIKDLQSLKKCD